MPFLDILIRNKENLQTSVFHKKTNTGILLNHFSFVSDSYKYGLIKTLIYSMYRINSTWTSFDIDLKNLKQVPIKNQYTLSKIGSAIKKLKNAINKTNDESLSGEIPNMETRYFKLHFIGMFSKVTQNKSEKLCKTFCKNAEVRLVFVRHSRTKFLIQEFSFQRLFINLYVLAVMLIMLGKRTDIMQPGFMITLVRIKSLMYTNT